MPSLKLYGARGARAGVSHMRPDRWTTVTDSSFTWEREALEFLREHLPDHEPWRAWSNFEFIDDQGRVNEVDLLVLGPRGLILVEIKSRPGNVEGDTHSWVWNNEGRSYTVDNPVLLANRKAKRLASLVRRQDALVKSKGRAPFIVEAVFLSKVRPPHKTDRARRGSRRRKDRGTKPERWASQIRDDGGSNLGQLTTFVMAALRERIPSRVVKVSR
jgi:hypothetical protein